MTIQGIIQNGVVVLEGGAALPDGTPVTVLVEQRQPAAALPEELMTEDQHRKLLEALDAIAALPDENPGDTFSGRDHDKVLYGKP